MRAAPQLLLACTLLAACGEDPEPGPGLRYDKASVEAFLTTEVRRTSPDLPVGPVTCPTVLEERVGAEAICSVELADVQTTYVVQVLAGRRFEARPEHPIADLRLIERQIAEKAGTGTSATCGPVRVVQLTPTQKVTCAIAGAGQNRRAVVTADKDGTIRVADA